MHFDTQTKIPHTLSEPEAKPSKEERMGKQKTEQKGTEASVPSGRVHFQANGGPTGTTGASDLAESIIKRNTEEIAGRRRSPTESTNRGNKVGSKNGNGHR